MPPLLPSPPDLSRRRLEPERMDDPSLDEGAHRLALAGLARLNLAARGERLLWRPLRELARGAGGDRPLAVLDMACGGGDPSVALLRRARRSGLRLAIVACDVSPVALAVTAERGRAAGLAVHEGPPEPGAWPPEGLSVARADVLAAAPPGRYDVAMCSLFLHHLADAAALTLLGTAKRVAEQAVLVHDLRRSRRGWRLAWLASRVLSRSPVVRFDALASVQAAFTPAELGFLAGRAGLDSLHATVHERWPERLLLDWRRP